MATNIKERNQHTPEGENFSHIFSDTFYRGTLIFFEFNSHLTPSNNR